MSALEAPRHYGTSDALPAIRRLKKYDLLKTTQWDLLADRSASPRRTQRAAAAAHPLS